MTAATLLSTLTPLPSWRDVVARAAPTELADEAPVAFEHRGVGYLGRLVTLRNPSDFGLGSSFSEFLIASPAEYDESEARSEANAIAARHSSVVRGGAQSLPFTAVRRESLKNPLMLFARCPRPSKAFD